jgi:hypothetical protein
VALALLTYSTTLAAAEIHVAESGKDTNSGDKNAPVASVHRAQELARQKPGSTVVMHEGTWFLPEPLLFTSADSGTTWRAAEGKKPVLSGGRTISGWTLKANGIWSAPVPGANDWYFRNLFVNGKRAIRARFPNRSAKDYAIRLHGYGKGGADTPETVTVDPQYVADWKNLTDVEVVGFKNWASYHKRIQQVDKATGACTMMLPNNSYSGRNMLTSKRYAFFENALELLDEPGEWYLDRTDEKLYYMPREGEELSKVAVIAPKLESVVVIEGTAEKPVKNLSFQGLTFSHGADRLPPEGHQGQQAGLNYGAPPPPSKITATYLLDSAFVGCTVSQGGGMGISLLEGACGNRIEGCHLHDLGNNGIQIHGPMEGKKPVEEKIPKNNRVENNYVHDCGTVYLGSCGIFVGAGQGTIISHNEVADLPYTGISVGWVWGATPSPICRNTIEWNYIHNVMREVCDGGPIYVLGFQPESSIRFNHIHGVRRGPYAHISPNPALYFDSGGSGFLVKENLLYDIAKNHFERLKEAREKFQFENNAYIEGLDNEKAALPEVRAKAGLEEKWKKLLEQ